MKLIVIALIIIVGIQFCFTFLYALILYRLGQYIKGKYPARYQNQLNPPNAYYNQLFNKQFSFPYNFGFLGTGASTEVYAGRHINKVINIAELENDQFLLGRAKKLKKIGNIYPIAFIIIIFSILLFVYWRS